MVEWYNSVVVSWYHGVMCKGVVGVSARLWLWGVFWGFVSRVMYGLCTGYPRLIYGACMNHIRYRYAIHTLCIRYRYAIDTLYIRYSFWILKGVFGFFKNGKLLITNVVKNNDISGFFSC